MKIGIIAAMASEREQLTRLVAEMRKERHGLFEYTIGQLGGNTLYIMECGIGKVNAAVGASELMARMQPDVVVSTGVAGGIDAKAGVMEVVAASEVVYHDVWCGMGNVYGQIQGLPPRFTCDERLVRKAVSLPSSVPVHAGLICTGDQFITNRVGLDAIKRRFPDGIAVDMESTAIAQVCYLYNTPFLSFRIISDTPGIEDHSAQYTGFWETMAERSFLTTWAFLSTLPDKLQL